MGLGGGGRSRDTEGKAQLQGSAYSYTYTVATLETSVLSPPFPMVFKDSRAPPCGPK